MKQLDLSDKQRNSLFVTYDSEKFCLYCKEPFGIYFLSSYLTKEEMVTDFEFNGISPKLDHGATMKYLAESNVL